MIHHVAVEIRAQDGDACVAFYGLLGFEEVRPAGTIGDRARWLERDGRQIHLFVSDSPVHPPDGHVALVAADYEADLAALRGAGHEVEPRTEHWGSPRAFARDPAGNRVELMAFPPPPGA